MESPDIRLSSSHYIKTYLSFVVADGCALFRGRLAVSRIRIARTAFSVLSQVFDDVSVFTALTFPYSIPDPRIGLLGGPISVKQNGRPGAERTQTLPAVPLLLSRRQIGVRRCLSPPSALRRPASTVGTDPCRQAVSASPSIEAWTVQM